MPTALRSLRRGLPRVPGGQPWPPAGEVEVEDGSDFLADLVVAAPPVATAQPTVGTAPAAVPAAESVVADAVVTEPAPVAEAVVAEAGPAPLAAAFAEPATAEQRVPLRRGLPRTAGSEPWPPGGFGVRVVPVTPYDLGPVAPVSPPTDAAAPAPASSPTAVPTVAPATSSSAAPITPLAAVATTEARLPLRRGLPRTANGQAWPAAGFGVREVAAEPFDLTPLTPTATPPGAPAAQTPAAALTTPAATAAAVETTTVRLPLRRGLPRTAKGEPWPPAGFGVRTVAVIPAEPTAPAEPVALAEPAPPTEAPATPEPAPAPVPATAPRTPAAPVAQPQPLPTRPATAPVAARTTSPAPATAPKPTLLDRLAIIRQHPVPAVVIAIAVVGGVVMLVGRLLGTDAMAGFLARYPGAYDLPAGAKPGFPTWVRVSHFLNMFFILLIIRSGLQVRYEKKPPAYWTPRWSWFGGKISLSLWLHQALDVLWLLNGLTFVVLLFVSDQWMRLVPTSWAVFPNALSALLQYVSLDWPTDNGWVNYNSLQQLAYFSVVFLAAPLAALTGIRMSGFWPAKAKRLSTLYPVELARAVHFPTMLFFSAFVVMHVTMVFATGALKNLNHMYGGSDQSGWAGFWVFVGAVAILALAWELARPMLLSPIANLLGRVSQR